MVVMLASGEIGRRLAEAEGHQRNIGREVDVAVVDRHRDGRRHRVDREGGAGGGAQIAVVLVPIVVDAHRGIADVGAGRRREGRRVGGGVDLGQGAERAALGGDVGGGEIGRRLAEAEGHQRNIGRQVDVAVVDRHRGGRRHGVDREGGAGAGARIAVVLVPIVG